MEHERRPTGPYERFVKRPLDCLLAALALAVLSPVLGVTALLVRLRLGSPVLFTQLRPGRVDARTGRERIFRLYKFRTMTDARGADGALLPDAARLTPFGRRLRASSLDELPELFNILRGEMAVCGPRPQLVRDMVFMTPAERRRHAVRPGLTGLAQARGRNAISWEGKLAADLEYIGKITFLGDVRIVLQTALKVFRREGITEAGMATAADYGDALLAAGRVSRAEYEAKQAEARRLLGECER